MNADDLDALEALARQATPGPWQALSTGVRGGNHWYIVDDGAALAYATKNDGDPDDKCQENAEYIAAANPSAVLTLIADLRRAQECIDAIREADKETDDFDSFGRSVAYILATRDEGNPE